MSEIFQAIECRARRLNCRKSTPLELGIFSTSHMTWGQVPHFWPKKTATSTSFFLNGLVKGCERENGRMLFHSVSHVFPIQIASSSLLHPNTHPNIPQPPNIPSSHHLPTASYSVCHSPLKPHIEAKRSSSGRFSRWSPSASRVWKRKPMASRRSWLSWGWVAT